MRTVLCIAVAAILSAISLVADAAPRKAAAPMTTASGVNPAVQATQSAAVPGDLRPENPVVPQLKIALGRSAGAAEAPAGSGAAAGGIDDRVARCQARVATSSRAACRARLAAAASAPVRR